MKPTTQPVWKTLPLQLGTACLSLLYAGFLAFMIVLNLIAIACDQTLLLISTNYALRHKDDCHDI